MEDAAMTDADQQEQQSREAGEASSSDLLIAAGRLESQLQERYGKSSISSNAESVAWSIDNLIAIVFSSTEIKLVHLSLPNKSQTLSIQEKPYLLRFGPEGNILFAAFESTQTCCIWVRVGNFLNQWALRQTWTTWQGKLLDLQWLGEPRQWCPKTKRRRPCRGPQFPSGNAHKEAGALTICDSGQVILFHGRVTDTSVWRVHMGRVPIPAHKKLAKAALGMVPDESSALLAYTLRISSKETLSTTSVEGDALGMFLEGGNQEGALQDQQSEPYDPNDGQDKIELLELQMDLVLSRLHLRLLPPIFTASHDITPSPSIRSLKDLLWLEAENEEQQGSKEAKLRLFANLNDQGSTTFRLWEAYREDAEMLSDAFYKLEAAKIKSNEEEREDWVVRAGQAQTLSAQEIWQCQSVPAQNKLVCVSKSVASSTALSGVPKERYERRIIDLSRLEVEDAISLQQVEGRLAFSPSGCLAAQVVDGKVRVVEMERSLRWSSDDALAYLPAVYTRSDLSDIARVCRLDHEDSRRACYIDETSTQHFTRMMEIRAQLSSKERSSTAANSSRLMLELLYAYKFLARADKAGSFDYAQLWTILAHLEWIVELVETLSRQAYLTHATFSISSPTEVVSEANTVKEEGSSMMETDILAMVTHKLPRIILSQIIVLLVRFCNWIHRVNRSKEEAKKVLDTRNKNKQINEMEGEVSYLWSLADNLSLAQMQVEEILFKSAIDLSQAGRFLKGYKGKESQDEKPRWWIDFQSGNRADLAKEMMESRCIRNALSLFCPDLDGREKGVTERDILTKVKLDQKMPHSICLGCTAKTQLPLHQDERCICGSACWWRMT